MFHADIIGKNKNSQAKIRLDYFYFYHKILEIIFNHFIMLYRGKLPDVNLENIRILAFDKDDTITPPNEPMERSRAEEIKRLTINRYILILTARDIDTCREQILEPMEQVCERKDRVIFACCNGSQIYKFDNQQQEYLLKSSLKWQLKPKEFFDEIGKKLAQELNAPDLYFEQRSETMGTFVCISRQSSDEERKNFDPNGDRRRAAIQKFRNLFPNEYEVIPGGKTSIDVSLYNKEAGMRHLLEYFQYPPCGDVLFFGDGFDGGNDTPVENIPNVLSVKVENYQQTQELLKQIP